MKKFILIMLLGIMCVSCCSCGSKTTNTDSSVSQNETVSKNKSDATTKEDEVKANPINIGDKITVDFAEITVDESGIQEDIQTSVTNGNFTYVSGPEASSDSKYVYMRGTIKNTSKSEIPVVKFFGNSEIDGYTYELNSSIIEEDGNSAYSLAPLVTYKYTIYAKVPNELADGDKPCSLNLGFHENFKDSFEKELSQCTYTYTLKVR